MTRSQMIAGKTAGSNLERQFDSICGRLAPNVLAQRGTQEKLLKLCTLKGDRRVLLEYLVRKGVPVALIITEIKKHPDAHARALELCRQQDPSAAKLVNYQQRPTPKVQEPQARKTTKVQTSSADKPAWQRHVPVFQSPAFGTAN